MCHHVLTNTLKGQVSDIEFGVIKSITSIDIHSKEETSKILSSRKPFFNINHCIEQQQSC